MRTVTVLLPFFAFGLLASAQDGTWEVHDRGRPNPPVVTPAETPGGLPSDAKVLFDGHNLDSFQSVKGGPAPWKVVDGVLTEVPGTGSIETKEPLGDCQLHVEWATPNPPQGEDQMRGNSGVIMMGMFEIQVIDSYNAKTYADGQAGAIYGQYPPLVNASRAPGVWQTYDIIFRGPRFDEQGKLIRRTRVTLIHNGVVVQDATQLTGPTAYHNRPPYFKVPSSAPLVLQEHGTTVRFRNIWVRELPEEREVLPANSFVVLHPEPSRFAEYAGEYQSKDSHLTIKSSEGKVSGEYSGANSRGKVENSMELLPISEDAFVAHQALGLDAVRIEFTRDSSGHVVSAVAFLGGKYVTFAKTGQS